MQDSSVAAPQVTRQTVGMAEPTNPWKSKSQWAIAGLVLLAAALGLWWYQASEPKLDQDDTRTCNELWDDWETAKATVERLGYGSDADTAYDAMMSTWDQYVAKGCGQ